MITERELQSLPYTEKNIRNITLSIIFYYNGLLHRNITNILFGAGSVQKLCQYSRGESVKVLTVFFLTNMKLKCIAACSYRNMKKTFNVVLEIYFHFYSNQYSFLFSFFSYRFIPTFNFV